MAVAESLLTVREVAAYLACAESTVQRLVRRGRLPATRVGAHLRFARADVEAYRAANAAPARKGRHRPEQVGDGGPSAATYLTRLQLVTGAFTQLQTPAKAAELVLSQCMRALDATAGILSLVRDRQVLELVHAIGYTPARLAPWRQMPIDARLPFPDVVRTGEPHFFETRAAFLAQYPQLADSGVASAAWAFIPLPIDDAVIGAFMLAFPAPRSFTPDDRAFLLVLAQQCAQAIERARLYAAEQAARARAMLLAETAQAFATAQLDLNVLLAQVARRVAEVIGDNCGVRLLSYDGLYLLPAVVYNPDRAAEQLLAALDDAPHPVGVGLTGKVAATGLPLFIPEIDPAEMRASAHPAYSAYLEQFPICGLMIVPLRARDRVIGTLNVSRASPGRPYTEADRQILDDLAGRAALAIDNARLYALEQRMRSAAERAAVRTATLQTITAALAGPHSPEQIADIAMSEGMRALGASAGALSLLNDDETFTIVRMIGYPPAVVAQWVGQRYPAAFNAPIPDAVRTRAPIWLESPDAITARYPHLAAQLTAAHGGAWATVPLAVRDRVFGGVTFLFAEARMFTEADRGLLLALAQQCAQAIERARLHAAEQAARAAVEAAHARMAMLAEASIELSASLDIQYTLQALARLAVPRLADWCVVDMLADDGAIETLVVAHADPAREAIGWELVRRYPINPDAPGGTAAVLRTRQPELMPEIAEEVLAAVVGDPEHLRLLMALGIRSSLCVPLIARGRALGTIALVAAESGRRYSAADLPLVEDLARRAALAVDNARLYRESQAAVQLRDTFFSVAAHELKTPLTSLLGQAQLIQRRAARESSLNERDQQSVRVIVSQAERLNAMILAMLDSARLEQGRLSIERQPVDLVALTGRVVDEIQPTLERHRIAVLGDPCPLVVDGDALRLEQVLQNLIGNAVKYSPRGGPVVVSLEQDGAQARVSVRDEGIGIPAAALPQLFQRFYRAGNVDVQHISGMGIGLYVIKEIVALHDGAVAVESVEGQGSKFTISLPITDDKMTR